MRLKLYMVGPSPYARKVRAAAHEHGLANQLECVEMNPHALPDELLAKNPLSRVPTLATEDGRVLVDSTAICLYLDAISTRGPLLPADQVRRFEVLNRYYIANGLMEAAVIRRVEGWAAQEPDRVKAIAKQKAVCGRVLGYFEQNIDALGDARPEHDVALDQLTLGCAIGFLDFRFPDDGWRPEHPKLAAWYETIAARASLVATRPND